MKSEWQEMCKVLAATREHSEARWYVLNRDNAQREGEMEWTTEGQIAPEQQDESGPTTLDVLADNAASQEGREG